MAAKAMWEVDPETRSKLADLQKVSKNNICCDCNAPSPQWASPKFGIFICLTCAGVHRGLGVHISFVRSISMDAFKSGEIERMRLGGNARWRKFFEEHEDTQMLGMSWDDATIAERYSGVVGDEWKERLSSQVEGREFVPGEVKRSSTSTPKATAGYAAPSAPRATLRTGTPLSASESQGEYSGAGSGKVKVDDRYFAKLGADNASRSEGLPPSQGGKYAGFGSTPNPSSEPQGDVDFATMQKDTVAALTKGFGWFTSTVTKTAKTVNDGYIQPTASRLAEGDFAKQAQLTAAQIAKQAQAAGKSAQDGFSRFVEGNEGNTRSAPIDESKKDFWDSFANIGEERERNTGSSSIGTSAMGMGKSKGAGQTASKPTGKDGWDDW